jgi:hypothetical protein
VIRGELTMWKLGKLEREREGRRIWNSGNQEERGSPLCRNQESWKGTGGLALSGLYPCDPRGTYYVEIRKTGTGEGGAENLELRKSGRKGKPSM